MTLRELKVRVDHAVSRLMDENDDLEVVIPNNKHSMGPMATTKVTNANRGIDWNSGMFIIWPEVKMGELD